MKIQQWLFKILKNKTLLTDAWTDGRTHGRTHGQCENSIPTTNKVCGGYNYFRNTIRVSNSLDPDQARHFVQPDLGPNCLQRLWAEDTSRQRVNKPICIYMGQQSDLGNYRICINLSHLDMFKLLSGRGFQNFHILCMQAVKAMVRQSICAGWSQQCDKY